MFRILSYLFILGAVALGFTWLANHYPDPVIIYVANMRISTSLPVALALILLALLFLYLVFALLKALFSLPGRSYRRLQIWKKTSQQELLSQSIVALLSGDQASVRILADKLKHTGDKDKSALISFVEAQALLAKGADSEALAVYESMRKDPKGRLLALFGLYQEAMKKDAFEPALGYAQEAFDKNPFLPWANQAILGDLVDKKQWEKAKAAFQKVEKATPRIEAKNQNLAQKHAVLYLAEALDLEENNPAAARSLALKAQKLAPNFIPATVISTRLLYRLHEARKASKMIENLWKVSPHPDLARVYLLGAEGQSPQERLERMRKLANFNPSTYDSLLCLAGCAFSAGELEFAKQKIEEALRLDPRESGFALLARIEEQLHKKAQFAPSYQEAWQASSVENLSAEDNVKAHEAGESVNPDMSADLNNRLEEHSGETPFSISADRFWIGDDRILKEWAPITPVKKLFDRVEWRAPVARLDGSLQREAFLSLADSSLLSSQALEREEASSDMEHEKEEKRSEEKGALKEEKSALSQESFSPYLLHEQWHTQAEQEKKAPFTHFTVDDPGT